MAWLLLPLFREEASLRLIFRTLGIRKITTSRAETAVETYSTPKRIDFCFPSNFLQSSKHEKHVTFHLFNRTLGTDLLPIFPFSSNKFRSDESSTQPNRKANHVNCLSQIPKWLTAANTFLFPTEIADSRHRVGKRSDLLLWPPLTIGSPMPSITSPLPDAARIRAPSVYHDDGRPTPGMMITRNSSGMKGLPPSFSPQIATRTNTPTAAAFRPRGRDCLKNRCCSVLLCVSLPELIHFSTMVRMKNHYFFPFFFPLGCHCSYRFPTSTTTPVSSMANQ